MIGRKTPQTLRTWARSPTVLFAAVILAAMTWASVSARDLGGEGLVSASLINDILYLPRCHLYLSICH
jgi:hypothetical protein